MAAHLHHHGVAVEHPHLDQQLLRDQMLVELHLLDLVQLATGHLAVLLLLQLVELQSAVCVDCHLLDLVQLAAGHLAVLLLLQFRCSQVSTATAVRVTLSVLTDFSP